MKERRLLFYNDARHFYMYCYEPPISLEDVWAPVDDVAGTGVDTFVYGFGAGPTMFHDTKVGEIFGSHLTEFDDLYAWRASENVRSLIKRGMDPLKLLIDRAHDKKLDFFASLRLTHNADPQDVRNSFNFTFRINHPEWCLKTSGKHNFNWVFPEVRAERLAIIRETVNEYRVDGMEIDLCFGPDYFEDGEIQQNAHIITEFMRDVRKTVSKASERRQTPIVLGARVLPTLEANLERGFKVLDWLEEGLLDFVVPSYYAQFMMDPDLPFEWLIEPARKANCMIYASLQPYVGPGYKNPTVAHYRAGAAALWQKGADAIYIPWFNWPMGPVEKDILSQIHDPDLLKEGDKHYILRENDKETLAFGYKGQLPRKLTNGMKAPGDTFRMYISSGDVTGCATLRLKLFYSTTHDKMTVSVNGSPLPEDACKATPHGFTYRWLEYPVKQGLLHAGANEIGIAIHSRPGNLTGQVEVQAIELVVNHPKPKAG